MLAVDTWSLNKESQNQKLYKHLVLGIRGLSLRPCPTTGFYFTHSNLERGIEMCINIYTPFIPRASGIGN